MTDINKYKDFLSQKDLLHRGWTKKEIELTFPRPDFIRTYRGSYDYTTYLYDLEEVARMERANHMDLGDELVNTRPGYVFWEDLYAQGWTEKQLKTLLPTPMKIRNWDGGTPSASYKVWEKNSIAHELAFAVTEEEKAKTLARRQKTATTKQLKQEVAQQVAMEIDALTAKYKSIPLVSFCPKRLPKLHFDVNYVQAIAKNNPEKILKFMVENDQNLNKRVKNFPGNNRVGVISNNHREEITQIAEDLGYPTNIHSKKFGHHWGFKSLEKRDFFVQEVMDYLAIAYDVIRIEVEQQEPIIDKTGG